ILTFFFRYMQEVIQRGHLFIAQPPLFKVAQGKKEEYLKDESEKTRFLLNRIAQLVEITPKSGMTIRGEALMPMLQRMDEYRSHARKLQSQGIPRAAIDVLLANGFSDRTALADLDRMNALEAALKAAGFEHVRQMADDITEVPVVQFAVGGNGTGKHVTINNELLSSYEFRQTAKSWDHFSAFGLAPYTVKHGDDLTTYKTMDELLDEVYKLAEKGLTIQRYKGLGEMNPDQLWETTMNPQTRRLLKVTIQDGVAADSIFTILMGDQVDPRREFIQDNALNVKNLDI
ncbi:MAG: DNA gyrase subunit B, partial [Thermoanaerobaculia bacterium]